MAGIHHKTLPIVRGEYILDHDDWINTDTHEGVFLGSLGASAWVVANDAPTVIKDYALVLQNSGYPVWLCDGVDDDFEINAAVAYLDVWLSRGNFYCANPILLNANYINIEANAGTVIWLSNGVNDDLFQGSGANRYHCRLANLRIDGNKANQTAGDVIDFTGLLSLTLENIKIANAYRHGVFADGGVQNSNNPVLINVNAQSCGSSGIYLKTVYAFRVLAGYMLLNNRGMTIESGGEGSISELIADQNTTRGVYLYSVKGVSVENCPYLGANGTHGLDIGGTSHECIASGNICVANGRSATGHGIRFSDTAHDNIITNNRCWDDQGTKTQDYGVEVGVGAYDNLIANNNLRDNQTGPLLNSAGGNNEIRHNQGYVTENHGSSTGTGAQQTIAHGLSFTPTAADIMLWCIENGAFPYHSAAPDAANIYVTAVNNQDWGWATAP